MNLKNLALATVASACLAQPLLAADKKEAQKPAKEAKQEAAKPAENKLLPLMTMEQAFAKALTIRAELVGSLRAKAAEYQKAGEKDKQDIIKQWQQNAQALSTMNRYMDVIYGLGGKRDYQYNRVTSEIYLRVGTVTEVFTRAVATRDALAKQIAALKQAIDKEKDAEKKKKLEAQQQFVVSRYALVVNALYQIFQITPARNYHFDAASRTLFLKTSDAEVAKLRDQLKAAQQKADRKTDKKADKNTDKKDR